LLVFIPKDPSIDVGDSENNGRCDSAATDLEALSAQAAEDAAVHAEVKKAYEITHKIAVYANDMMIAGRINGFNVSSNNIWSFFYVDLILHFVV
jgi:hypothetical protein